MRPLFCAALIVVSGAVAGISAGTGAASTSTPGDGCLVVSKGFGTVTISLTRGVVFGRFLSGTLYYSDLNLDQTRLPITHNASATKVGDHVWRYGPADNLRFRTDGPTKLTVVATSMDLSVAGKGTAVLSTKTGKTSFIQQFAGTYSADAASFCADPTTFQKMPIVPTAVPISSAVASTG
jgi:hypothetical protein